MTSRVLNRFQAHLSSFVTNFDFEIIYQSGCIQTQTDAQSPNSDYVPLEGEETYNLQEIVVLKPEQFELPIKAT